MNRCSTKRHSFKGIRGAWSRWSTDHGLFWICVTTRVVGHFSMRALSSLLRAQASCRTACAVRRKGYQPHRGNAYERCLARWRRQSSRANPRWKEKHSWPNPEVWHVSGMRQAVWWQSRKVQCAPTGAQGRVPAGPAVGCFARRLLGLACGDGVPVARFAPKRASWNTLVVLSSSCGGAGQIFWWPLCFPEASWVGFRRFFFKMSPCPMGRINHVGIP